MRNDSVKSLSAELGKLYTNFYSRWSSLARNNHFLDKENIITTLSLYLFICIFVNKQLLEWYAFSFIGKCTELLNCSLLLLPSQSCFLSSLFLLINFFISLSLPLPLYISPFYPPFSISLSHRISPCYIPFIIIFPQNFPSSEWL